MYISNRVIIIDQRLSIPVIPKLWDTELLCTEYTQNYWLTLVPGNLSQLTRVPVDSSPRRLSVDRRRNYLDRVLFDLSPRHMSVDRRWNYLAQVLFNSSHSRLSVNRRWNYLARVLVDLSPRRPSVDRCWNYLARVPVVCPSADVETVDSYPSRLSFDRRNL